MAKTYHLKITGGDTVDVPENEFRLIEEAVYNKREGMVKVGDMMFSPRDVRRVTSSYDTATPTFYEDRPEVSDEQRRKNVRRLRWLRTYFFQRYNVINNIPREEWGEYRQFVKWYQSAIQGERREKKQAFRKEFFDVAFQNSEEFDACFKSWLKATDPQVDPREYRRDDHTPNALGFRDKDVQLASQIMGAKLDG